MAITQELQQFINEHANDWLRAAMHGYADRGRGVLLVTTDTNCLVGLPCYVPARQVEHIPAMMVCLVAMRGYCPEHEAVVAFSQGGGEIDAVVVLNREMIRPDAGQNEEE